MSTADDKRLQDQMNAANNAGAAGQEYVPGREFTECTRDDCPAFHVVWGERKYFQGFPPKGIHTSPPCGSCGEPSIHRITLRGEPMPVCLRHLNHWRTPADDVPPDTRSEVEALAGFEIETRYEGGQPNGLGVIEDSQYREWYSEARETHHRRVITLVGPWTPGSIKDIGGEQWADHNSLDEVAELAQHDAQVAAKAEQDIYATVNLSGPARRNVEVQALRDAADELDDDRALFVEIEGICSDPPHGSPSVAADEIQDLIAKRLRDRADRIGGDRG